MCALARKSSRTEIMHIGAIVHLVSVVTSCTIHISNLSAQGYTLYMYNGPHDLFCICVCVCVCFIRNCLGVRTTALKHVTLYGYKKGAPWRGDLRVAFSLVANISKRTKIGRHVTCLKAAARESSLIIMWHFVIRLNYTRVATFSLRNPRLLRKDVVKIVI